MRIISPISQVSDIEELQIKKCLEANFHSALDAKYAISDEIIWSTFIHPLKELTKDQVISAISQVYSCNRTFGGSYSSGLLSFPSKKERETERTKA